MGEVRTEITLVNLRDPGKAEDRLMAESEVRRLTVKAVVDADLRYDGAWPVVINEETREKLGLRVKRTGETTGARGGTVPCQVTEPVMVLWKDRDTEYKAVVLPEKEAVLLGALPLEGMDLTVNPLRNEVMGGHGDTIRIVAK